MNVHYLKHVEFEGLGSMENLLQNHECSLSHTCLYEDQALPSIDNIDALIVMGGPMGVYDDQEYPWLTSEKKFIESVIKRDVPVLGVCLGAQLIANVLDAKVTKNPHEEIGWYPVTSQPGASKISAMTFPDQFDAFHWHGDTFDIPSGATNLLASDGCAHQGFMFGENTLGLQFHLEMLPENVRVIYHECGQVDKRGDYVQSLEEMLAPTDKFDEAEKITKQLVEGFIFKKAPQ